MSFKTPQTTQTKFVLIKINQIKAELKKKIKEIFSLKVKSLNVIYRDIKAHHAKSRDCDNLSVSAVDKEKKQ